MNKTIILDDKKIGELSLKDSTIVITLDESRHKIFVMTKIEVITNKLNHKIELSTKNREIVVKNLNIPLAKILIQEISILSKESNFDEQIRNEYIKSKNEKLKNSKRNKDEEIRASHSPS